MKLKKYIIDSRTGDKEAQRQLFMISNGMLNGIALRYVIDAAAAQDVLQESYIKIFSSLDRFVYKDDKSTYAWMKKIVVFESLRYLRKLNHWNRKNELTYTTVIKNSHELFQDDLFNILLKLPLKQRLVFNMYAIEGYSHKEIAERLSIPESSSRTFLTRARIKLQKLLPQNFKYESV